MGMSSTPAPPTPPDPVATANAQAQANSKAAVTQQQVNSVDQVTPYGNLNYTQGDPWADGTPHLKATTTLSPEEQRNLDQQHQFDNLVNTLGINQTTKLTGLMDKPVDLSSPATEARTLDLASKRLDPMLTTRRAQVETQLYNSGARPGSEAWNNGMKLLGQDENDARNQLILTGHDQAVKDTLTERNQPINETTALMSGGQVTQPTFTNTPTAQVGSPDIGGMTYQSYQLGPLAQWNNQNAVNQAKMAGLFSIGAAAAGGGARALGGWAGK